MSMGPMGGQQQTPFSTTLQSPQTVTNQQDAMIRNAFGQLGLAGVGTGAQQINPAMYNQLAQGFSTGQVTPENFQNQFYNTVGSMSQPAVSQMATPFQASPAPAPKKIPPNSIFGMTQQNAIPAATNTPKTAALPGFSQVDLGPSQDTIQNRLQDLQLSQISGARPSGDRQFYQPVYQPTYDNYASPMTAFGVSTYGMNPYQAIDVMNRGYNEFYAPPPVFNIPNPAYVAPTPPPSRSVLRRPGGGLGGGIASLVAGSGRR